MVKIPALFLCLLLGTFYGQAQSLIIIAGTGTGGYNGDTIPAITAELYNPTGVVVDARGNIYVADWDNARVRKIDTGGIITTIAGTGVFGYTGDSGLAVDAELSNPVGITLGPGGDIYFTDQYNHAIRKIDTAGIITTVVTSLSAPSGIAFDTKGNLFVTEQTAYRITKIDTAGNKTKVTGNDTAGERGDNGPAIAAEIDLPYGICFDAKGNLYFTELSGRVRRIDTSGIITAVAGTDSLGYNGDGIPDTIAELSDAEGITFDQQSNLYIADGANNRIRKVDTSGIISTYVGPGGYISDSIGFESALTFDASGNLYLLDATGNYVRKVIPGPPPVAGFTASPYNICTGSSVNFTDTSTGSPVRRQWTFSGGTPDTSTAKTPTITYNTAGAYSVKLVVSNSNGSDSLTKNTYITVYPSPVPVVSAADSLICSGDSTQVCTADTFTSYLWNTGSTSYCTTARAAGGYWVTVSDANHCSAVSGHQEVNVYPVPSVSIVVQGDTLSSYGQVDYQWRLDGSPIAGATAPLYIANQPGSYTLQITDSNGCKAISEPVSITGVNDLTEEEQISVYPNPNSTGSWQLAVGNELIGSRLEVYDDEGRMIFQSEIRNPQSAITISDLPSGIYFLRVSSADVSIVKKLVKL